MKDLKISNLNDLYGSLLTDKQQQIVKSYYDYDLTLSEIAQNCSITRQAVLDALKKAEKELYKLEDSLGFYAKTVLIKDGLANISEELLKSGQLDLLAKVKDIEGKI